MKQGDDYAQGWPHPKPSYWAQPQAVGTAAEAPGRVPQAVALSPICLAPDTSREGDKTWGPDMKQLGLPLLQVQMSTIMFPQVIANPIRGFEKKPVPGKVTTSTDFTNFTLIPCLINYTSKNTTSSQSWFLIAGNTTLPINRRPQKSETVNSTQRKAPRSDHSTTDLPRVGEVLSARSHNESHRNRW